MIYFLRGTCLAHLDKTSCHHRENTALNRVSVKPLPQQHDQEQEVTKETKDDEDSIKNNDNNEEVLIPVKNGYNCSKLYVLDHLNIFLK